MARLSVTVVDWDGRSGDAERVALTRERETVREVSTVFEAVADAGNDALREPE